MSVLGTIALVLASQTPVVADAPTWSIGAGLGTIVTGGLGPAAPTVSAGVEARLAPWLWLGARGFGSYARSNSDGWTEHRLDETFRVSDAESTSFGWGVMSGPRFVINPGHVVRVSVSALAGVVGHGFETRQTRAPEDGGPASQEENDVDILGAVAELGGGAEATLTEGIVVRFVSPVVRGGWSQMARQGAVISEDWSIGLAVAPTLEMRVLF